MFRSAATTDLQNAISKARQIKCPVKALAERAYLVVTPQGHRQAVRVEQINGPRYGRCSCKAGAAGTACRHLPKAAPVDSGLQVVRAH